MEEKAIVENVKFRILCESVIEGTGAATKSPGWLEKAIVIC